MSAAADVIEPVVHFVVAVAVAVAVAAVVEGNHVFNCATSPRGHAAPAPLCRTETIEHSAARLKTRTRLCHVHAF